MFLRPLPEAVLVFFASVGPLMAPSWEGCVGVPVGPLLSWLLNFSPSAPYHHGAQTSSLYTFVIS